MAVSHHGAGRLSQARSLYQGILHIAPQHPTALHLLGVLSHQEGRNDDSLKWISEALAVQPDFPDALNNHGIVLQELGRMDEAVGSYQKALALTPGFAWCHNNLGNALKELGRLEEAMASFREALRLKPHFPVAHNNLVYTRQFQPGVTAEELKELHVGWDHRHAASLRDQWPDHGNDPDPDRPLRIGMVSPNLGRHPVGYFLIRLFENKPDDLEFLCYSDRKPDNLTERFKKASDGWLEIGGMPDATLAHRIRSDRVDILFHLAGHTSGNRLLTLARKPAPIQISWVGYAGTTGLEAMDYLISDRFHTPEGQDIGFTERLIRMPDSYICYAPPPYAPPVGPPPFETNGHVTFGFFGTPAKINNSVLAAWSKILQEVPGSRLVLKYPAMDCTGNRKRIVEEIARHGVDASRLTLEGESPHQEMLARYNGIDIILDTFPFSGGLTACEAMWMGVPVVACPGETFAGRHSASHLANVGLSQLVARDMEEYVSTAVALGKEPSELARLRSGLRDRVAQSPLCDGLRFANNFTQAMRTVWQEWSSTKPVGR